MALAEAGYRAEFECAAQVYATGNFAAITQQCVADYLSMGLSSFFVLGFNILAMFLVGAAFTKLRLFHHLVDHRLLWRRLLIWGGIVGMAGNTLYATLIMDQVCYNLSFPLLIATIGHGIGTPLLMRASVAAICLLALQPAWGQRLHVLAPLGQEVKRFLLALPVRHHHANARH